MWQKRIKANLLKWQDSKYRSFQLKLIPNLQANTIIGVRTPQLKKYAQYLATQKNIQEFLCAVPHQYFEENQLHAFIISLDKNFSHCIEAVSLFLPYINNWATRPLHRQSTPRSADSRSLAERPAPHGSREVEIGRASCRERV